MRQLLLLKKDSPEKERKFSKFGSKYLIKNGKVFEIKQFGPIKCYILIENDANFFEKYLSHKEKRKFSSFSNVPTDYDWKIVKNDCRTILVDITPKCNSDCRVCFKKAYTFDEMKIENFKKILSKIGHEKNIVLFGGEPTMRRDIFEMLRLIKKSGNIPMIHTNGIKLVNLEYVKKLKRSGLRVLSLSFDGFTEEIYEKLRGDRQQLYMKMKALKNLEKVGIKVRLNSTIVDGINLNQIPIFLKFAIKNNHFIEGVFFLPLNPYDGRVDIKFNKICNWSDIINAFNEANPNITNEYYLEFQRLKKNLSHFLNKVINFMGVIYKINKYEIEELIPLDEMRKVNEMIEERKYISLFSYVIRQKHIKLINLIRLFSSSRWEAKLLGIDTLYLAVGWVNTPTANIPIKLDGVNIRELDDKFILEANAPV